MEMQVRESNQICKTSTTTTTATTTTMATTTANHSEQEIYEIACALDQYMLNYFVLNPTSLLKIQNMSIMVEEHQYTVVDAVLANEYSENREKWCSSIQLLDWSQEID